MQTLQSIKNFYDTFLMKINIPDCSPKAFFEGTHRLCSPQETLEKIQQEPRRIGLTRVADITGFDHIGVPVTSTIRPNSLSLSTSSGKGLTKEAAIVSGIMEALELFQAETHVFDTITSTWEELQNEAVSPLQLNLRKNAILPKNWPYKWCFGWDLITKKEIAVPLMAVTLDYRLGENDPYGLDVFEITSNGLASGNHPLEAIISGIYEVIERDAITCVGERAPRIQLGTIVYPTIQKLIAQLKQADVELILFDCTIDTDVPVFKAQTYDQNVGLTVGYGAHLDPEVAMLRALTEAIQARAVFISGSRDDLFLSTFQVFRKFRTQHRLDKMGKTIDANSYKNEATPTFEGDIQLLLTKLKKIGIAHVIVFDLSSENISVFRVIIPGLEGYKTATYQVGKRAKSSFSEQAFHMPAGAM